MEQKKPMINLIGIECPLETEAKFDTWYNEKHIPDLIKFKGVKSVTQYKFMGTAGEKGYGGKSALPTFLTAYEFESQKDFEEYEASSILAAAREDALQIFKDTGASVVIRAQYESIKKWQR